MLHIIDNTTDAVVGELPRYKLLSAKHTQDADAKAEIMDFVVDGQAEELAVRRRVVFPDDDGIFRETIIEKVEEQAEETRVYTNASYLEDLGNARPIAPDRKEQYTAEQWVTFALNGTPWEPGIIEYNGFRTISWSGFNSPYELLNVIATRFDMSLRFRIEVEFNEVVGRYVDMVKINHLFNGKEIVRGKDLKEFKRIINTENLATALWCLGPEQSEEGAERIETLLYDDEANDKWGTPGQYVWQVYEPTTENEDMTLARLTTLGKTELNKRKEPIIDYEITAVNLGHLYGHERVRLYDKVRIKDEEFNHYAEANVKRIERDMLVDSDRVFTFGDIVEFERQDLRAEFDKIVSALRERIRNTASNADQIRQDLEDNVFEFEPAITKGNTPPTSPDEGDLWLETSTKTWYRWDGTDWTESSITHPGEIGAPTREEALYDDLTATYDSISIRHAELQNEALRLIDSEYLVDQTAKDALNASFSAVNGLFEDIEDALGAMTPQTATIGALINVQALIVDYRNAVHQLSVDMRSATEAIEARFSLLQSQYSEEKMQDALDKIATTFDLEVVDGELIGDVVLIETLNQTKQDLQDQLADAIENLEDGKIAELSGDIDFINGVLDLKLDKTELDPIKDTIATHTTTINAQGDSISLLQQTTQVQGEDITQWSAQTTATAQELETVRGRVTATENGLTQAETAILENADAILNRVKTVDYDIDYAGLVSRLDSADSERLQMSNLIQDRVTKTTYNSGISSTRQYAEGVAGSAETSAKAHADTVASSAETSAKAHAETKAQEAETNAKAYTDDELESVDSRITENETLISQNGEQIDLRAKHTELNQAAETLSQVISELLIDTTNGLTYTYNENGNITGYSIGPGGVHFDTDLFTINDGDVKIENGQTTIKDAYIDKLFGKQATFDHLNALGINARKITSASGDSELNIEGGLMEWTRGNGDHMEMTMDGLYMYDSSGSPRFSIDSTIAKTSALGTSNANVYLAPQAGYEARVVDYRDIPGDGLVGSYRYLDVRAKGFYGDFLNANAAAPLNHLYIRPSGGREVRITNSETTTTYANLRADGLYGNHLTNNSAEGQSSHVYVRPLNGGEVRITEGTSTTTYGGLRARWLYANSLYSNTTANLFLRADNEVRFTSHGSTSTYRSVRGLFAYMDAFDVNTGTHMYARPKSGGEFRVTRTGTTGTYEDLRAGEIKTEKGQYSSHTSGNTYMGVATGEFRVTNNNFYNGGNTTYRDIRFQNWRAMSHEKYKYDIKEWNLNVIDILKDELQLYTYKLKNDEGTEKDLIHQGIVIRENSNDDRFPAEWREGDGFNGNNVIWWAVKGVQELAFKVEALEAEIEALKKQQ